MFVRCFTLTSAFYLIDSDDGGESLADLWDGNDKTAARYIVTRMRLAGGNINAVSPAWVRSYLSNIFSAMRSMHCDLIVAGNNRGFSNDALSVTVAKVLGVPYISELLNLFPDSENLPNAIIAPSHYAARHESIRSLGRSTDSNSSSAVEVIIISPGIDLKRFDVSLRGSLAKWRHPKCENINNCVVIAFIGRLKAEKNPVLFVMAAHYIWSRLKSARFVVIGDGPLRGDVEDIVNILGISPVGWLATRCRLL